MSAGLVVLVSVLNVLDPAALATEEQVLGLTHNVRLIAGDLSARFPSARRCVCPKLCRSAPLAAWFREFLEEREPGGAERSLHTPLEVPDTTEKALVCLLQATTRHAFLSTGHVPDFFNKARGLAGYLADDHATVTAVRRRSSVASPTITRPRIVRVPG